MIPLKLTMVGILPLFLVFAGCKEAEQPKAALRPVLTMTVAPVEVETFGPFASTVEARYQTQLGFQLAGRMVARDVYVGDVVHTGQRLAALDPTVTQFALTRAQADVADAKAQLANAGGVEERQRTLATGGNAPQAALDNAVASRDTAKARLDQAQAALQAAEDQIGYTELRAQFDGVITVWNAEVGQYVGNGAAVVTVARPDIREAVVDIPDELIASVHPKMPFTVRLQSEPAVTATAIVREIAPLADPATRSHRVRLTLQTPSAAFRIGTTIGVSVDRHIAPRITVPAQAVLSQDGKSFVWLLAPDGNSVLRRAVTLNGSSDDQVLVGSGLAAGDKVVIAGVHSLVDGQAVAGEAGATTTKAKGTRL
ncbi:efflux RND transporter periplasmic adaptor subunit [Beijerinckia sp. L45]|uniref:efflux RND transporter periplasmic adaptor subunit n=1 Tax=Beijerinckia sp. L45 TaxID=1641855 RepID=UPI001FED9CFB|nr:efflux RND transporter periplasmic adaptor subunit [Beijerinckia sp. L45]